MRNCTYCKELQVTHKIKSPGDLLKTLKVVKDNLASGRILESDYWPKGAVKISRVKFSELSETDQWDDVLEYYFKCSRCDLVFRLFVETYHGQGGY